MLITFLSEDEFLEISTQINILWSYTLLFESSGLTKEVSYAHQGYINLIKNTVKL